MPLPAVAATCDGAAAVPLAGKPCGKAGSLSRLCSKGCILRLDFLSTKIVINSQGDRKGTPLLYTSLGSHPPVYSRGVPLRRQVASRACPVRYWRVSTNPASGKFSPFYMALCRGCESL